MVRRSFPLNSLYHDSGMLCAFIICNLSARTFILRKEHLTNILYNLYTRVKIALFVKAIKEQLDKTTQYTMAYCYSEKSISRGTADFCLHTLYL